MHSTNVEPKADAVGFAAQVFALYTTNLGEWAGTLVGLAAFFVMFTTLSTILDGMPRLVATCIGVLKHPDQPRYAVIDGSPLLYGKMAILAAAAIGVVRSILL